MTQVNRGDVEGLVEAKLHAKGPATAKQLAEWLECEVRDVVVALGRLINAGVVNPQMRTVGRHKNAELFWMIKKPVGEP